MAAQIYSSELLKKKLGFPLWQPDPGPNPAVEIADVGYIFKGKAFIRLFNASKDEGDPSNEYGVPLPHTPLVIGPVHRDTPLPALDPILSKSVNGHTVGGDLQGGPFLQVGGRFNFRCEDQRGAALILGGLGYSEDALCEEDFVNYARAYHSAWLRFANANKRGIALDDLILVTGWVKSSSWACAAFSENSRGSSITFKAGQTFVEGGFVWGSWEANRAVDKHSGPQRLSPPEGSHSRATSMAEGHTTGAIDHPSPSSMQASGASPSNQCLFLSGYKICDRRTYLLRKVRVTNKVNNGFKTVSPPLITTKAGTPTTSQHKPAGSTTQQSSQPSDRLVDKATIRDSVPSEKDLTLFVGPNTPGKEVEPELSSLAGSLGELSPLDEEIDRFLQLNSDKELSIFDYLLYYILEVSGAELAIVHTDDLDFFSHENIDVNNIVDSLHVLGPVVHVDDNNVAMLKETYQRIHPSSKTTENQPPRDLAHPLSPPLREDSLYRFTRDSGVKWSGKNPPAPEKGPLNILCLDGGGIHGLTSLYILKVLMDKLKLKSSSSREIKPHEVFDIICGTSTGGIIALMLGRLQMGVEEAITAYLGLSKSVLNVEPTTSLRAQQIFQRGFKWSGKKTSPKILLKASKLEKWVKDLLAKYGHLAYQNQIQLKDPSDGKDRSCRTFVVAVHEAYCDAPPARLRSYDLNTREADECNLWEAAKATTASVPFFGPATFGVPPQTFLEGAFSTSSNPSQIALDEVTKVFPYKTIGCFLSVGTGIHDVLPKEASDTLAMGCMLITQSCELVHIAMDKHFREKTGSYDNQYARFSVPGLNNIRSNEWSHHQELYDATSSYMEQREQKQRSNTCITALEDRMKTNERINRSSFSGYRKY